MLDNYCNSLSDEAQLKIALRLSKMALRVWNTHFNRNPTDIDVINSLIGDSNRVKRGAKTIDIDFPTRALEKIERSYLGIKESSRQNPIPLLKRDPTLSPMLATSMQPLTNKRWDIVLPESVRLVFTSVFNILVWLQLKRRNFNGETHIYVAINQGADVLLRESLISTEELNKILYEYNGEKRNDIEDSEWENFHTVGETEPLNVEDIYRKIIGKNHFEGGCGIELAKEALRQMREEGKSYWDQLEDYYSGTSKTYSYSKEMQSFYRNEFDSIVGSFSNDIIMSEEEMLFFIASKSSTDLRNGGLEI